MTFTGVNPTSDEVERIRLLLSTYQDGTGQLVLKGQDGTLPNWRDFERSAALAFQGHANESKTFFDVVVPVAGQPNAYFGISCKMRAELRQVIKKDTIYVEVSNAAGDFWNAVRQVGINTTDELNAQPGEAGRAILELVESWHHIGGGYAINLDKSYYLILQYDTKRLEYQLFQLPLSIPPASEFDWSVRHSVRKDTSRTLVGSKDGRKVVEWYADSGGQLKYYPLAKDALWRSPIFKLEPLPDSEDGYGVLQKAVAYFPEQWQAVGY